VRHLQVRPPHADSSPQLFFDTDDRVYLSVSTWIGDNPGSPYITEIDLDSGRSLGPLTLLRRGEVGNKISEGSHIFKKDGWYYLLTAEGGTEVEHQEWVCRSKTGPFGPWEVGPTAGASKGAHNDNHGDDNDDNDDRNAGKDPIVVNPMVYNGDHPLVRQTGHMDLVEGPDGRWWAVFLAVRPVWDGDEPLLSQLGRETFLAPVEWREGWPIVNRRQPISLDGAQDAALPRTPERYTVDLSFKEGMGEPNRSHIPLKSRFHQTSSSSPFSPAPSKSLLFLLSRLPLLPGCTIFPSGPIFPSCASCPLSPLPCLLVPCSVFVTCLSRPIPLPSAWSTARADPTPPQTSTLQDGITSAPP
jgi:hypothetical protein